MVSADLVTLLGVSVFKLSWMFSWMFNTANDAVQKSWNWTALVFYFVLQLINFYLFLLLAG